MTFAPRVMRLAAISLAAVAIAACSAPPPAEHRSIPGPRAEWLEHQHRAPIARQQSVLQPRESAQPQDVRKPQDSQSPSRGTHADRYRTNAPGTAVTINEDATRAYLDRAIEQRRVVPPVPSPQVIVERPVEVTQYQPVHDYDPYWQYRQAPTWRRSGSSFPVNTAVGAGLGAIIGHQSGRRDRGAAIGAGIGLLFDLWR